ncbi:hypothetical protein TrLO_g7299 [Triparma laevis f. longispina]|uniref:t-SNARE coiled-coil homology domain-containing protein n=2 Tax=Triparma laevis TaxID=1534972 RepID=A0A9W6ZFT5_9STRA|nr:hypothetical protein TrLO_g7299 [Triparma laevis f. longispina]
MSKLDGEIENLLASLYTIQSDTGAHESSLALKPKSAPGKKTDRFMEIKTSMITRLQQIKDLMQSASENLQGSEGLSDPKDVIRQQSQIREEIRMLTEEWREIDGIYRIEAKKKRSKFTQEELKNQQHTVLQLNEEIKRIQEIQRSGYTKNTTSSGFTSAGRTVVSMEDSSLFQKGTGDGYTQESTVTSSSVEMTSSQSAQVQQLKERDQDFDLQISEIGKGILDLQDYALEQNEEVKRQNLMLDSLAGKIDNVHDHVTNVNSKMKTTLDAVGRKGDKLCVDIICLVLAIGFAAVIYSIYKETN